MPARPSTYRARVYAHACAHAGARVDSLFAMAEYVSDFGGRCPGGGRRRLQSEHGRRVVSLLSYELGTINNFRAKVEIKCE